MGQVAAFAGLRLWGDVRSTEDFLTHVVSHQHAYLVLGRAITSLTAIGALVVMYRFGSLFGGPWVGAMTTLLCATNLTFIAMSAISKEEPLYWALLMTACLSAWSASASGRRRQLLWAGAAIGAAFAAKVIGVFAIVLAAVPLWRKAQEVPLSRRLLCSMWIVIGAVVGALVLYPFLLTDTARVVSSVTSVKNQLVEWHGISRLALATYLDTHLPNIVGWPVYVLGLAGLLVQLRRDPRGPATLTIAPMAILVYVGLRRGYSMAHYAVPVALTLFALAASAVVDVARALPRRSRWLVGVALVVLQGTNTAYLAGSIRHARVLFGEDTRLLARDYIEANAEAGECVLMTDAIASFGH
jgi:hypothetical protein